MREALITLLKSRPDIKITSGGFKIERIVSEGRFCVHQENGDFQFYDNAEQAVEAFLMCFDI